MKPHSKVKRQKGINREAENGHTILLFIQARPWALAPETALLKTKKIFVQLGMWLVPPETKVSAKR